MCIRDSVYRRREKMGRREVIRVGCMNVRGVNEDLKREEVGLMFEEKRLDVLGITETKLKGKREMDFGEYKGMISGVNERVRAREGVGIVMRKEVWDKVRLCNQVSSRIMWVKAVSYTHLRAHE